MGACATATAGGGGWGEKSGVLVNVLNEMCRAVLGVHAAKIRFCH